jgi:serine/threonine protein kinase
VACFSYQNVTHHQDDSPESTILKIGIECIERSGNVKASKNLPDWIISSLEVDIDMEEELGSGGFSAVRKGMWNGLLVAVKIMTSETSPKVIRLWFSFPLFELIFVSQMLMREIKVWSSLSHDNVLPFYGASFATDAPFIVSRYMKNGNLPRYLRQRPNANRVQLAR